MTEKTTLPTLESAAAQADDPHDAAPVLTVIVPVYNEAATVFELLTRVLAAPCSKQVIVVDDGSTDATPTILDARQDDPRVEVLRHAANRGKGAAIRTALKRARGRFTIIQDADAEYDPADYPRLLQPLVSGDARVVYGSRYLARPRVFWERWRPLRAGLAALNAAVRLLYGTRLTDMCTCYKVLPTRLLSDLDLQCEGFDFCPEVTAKICRLGIKIVEVPIAYHSRSRQEGKKIRWRDGWQALAVLWRLRRWEPTAQRSAEKAKCSWERSLLAANHASTDAGSVGARAGKAK